MPPTSVRLRTPGFNASPLGDITPNQQVFQLAELFDTFDDAVVWVKDRQGRYCWVNRAFRLAYLQDFPAGNPSDTESILGKTDYDLSPALLADHYRLDDELVLAGQRIVSRIEQVGPTAELARWNVTTKIPLRDASGAIVGTAGVTRRLDASEQDAATHAGFGAVLACLRDRYGSPLTNHELARLANMSVRAFERKFHSAFHLTPQKYLRRLRLHMAGRILAYTGRPLADVAASCGFADQSHFTREFRRHFGTTPKEYRAIYAASGKPDAPGTNSAASAQETSHSGR